MKTILEESKENCEYNQDSLRQYDKHFIESFKDGVEFAQKWIKVEDELPEQVEKLIGNNIKSENVLVKRKWDDTGEIAIEINCRFLPSPRIGFLWNIEYKGSSIIEWRPIDRF